MTKPSVKILHLFRHGQTAWNVEQRLQGHTDIPLNDEGRRQALALQKYFAENTVNVFFSSDLSRAKETAQIANAQLRRELKITPHLRESFLGEIEGKTKDEVFHAYGRESWEKWNHMGPEHFDFRYPQAESARDTIIRVLETLKSFCLSEDFTAAGVCTHGLVLRRVLHYVNPEIPGVIPVPNCSVYRLEYDLQQDRFHFAYNTPL